MHHRKRFFFLVVLLIFVVLPVAAQQTDTLRKTIPATVTAHRYGFDAAVNFNTDRAYPKTFEPFEAAFMANNLGYTVFFSKVNNARRYSGKEKREIYRTGRGSVELYFQTDHWLNPNTGKVEEIPNYYRVNWIRGEKEALHVDTVGPKPIRYPNHGQEMYDASGGVFGYDFNTNQTGTNELKEFVDYFNFEKRYLQTLRDDKPIWTLSYGNGQTGSAAVFEKEKLIYGGRNSLYGRDSIENTFSYYGDWKGAPLGLNPNGVEDKLANSISRPNTTRLLSYIIENREFDRSRLDTALHFCVQSLEKALLKNGFYSTFAHWNYFYGPSSPYTLSDHRDMYISLIKKTRQKIDELGLNVYAESYEMIIAYYIARSMVASVQAFEKGSIVTLSVDLHQEKNIDLALLESPVSVEINLSDSKLSESDIRSSSERVTGIRKVENDIYVLDLDLQKSDASFVVEIEKTDSPDYLNFAPPRIISYDFKKMKCKITTDQKTNVVLYYKTKEEVRYFRVLKRSNLNAKEHLIDLETNKLKLAFKKILPENIYVGVISTKTKQSTLLRLK